MSAFQDYCIVCDRLCVHNEIYCSAKCQELDSTPITLQGKDDIPHDHYRTKLEEKNNFNYLSPLLSGAVVSNDINHLDLNDINSKSNQRSINISTPSSRHVNLISQYLASSASVNYKKWLNNTNLISH
ncbi:Hypothetical protein PP7435_CHR2-0947 [Komagataella phaffii CBS 7435]|uniref:Uncharacterized protein n=2 Tax=Komagataella phaffii TaxID=460519 RepID=C4R0E9_KOMPG|nr:Hypothetical protein PAS_chr2-1_0353 [Komagataella phaffii GS115]AOA62707.1 GQ67_00391T0 [Komagataella phaffii]CAH2448511.1 Hypothetical protein BQ9382_C2-5095 [Komagataella phaffii CBS 7435]AOA67263.1 GQ68_00998T0 [Komagataella phaffii GS115]CAY68973.1 Hypothetical protein PAS_chr2-1_0353 [Komagataella phaffii GS115]CCA38628.1 Hypothetical protein PP7435_CHR2-0947 [Komagataella phaffii CBS 7435]